MYVAHIFTANTIQPSECKFNARRLHKFHVVLNDIPTQKKNRKAVCKIFTLFQLHC